MYVDLQRFMYYVDDACPDLDKTIKSNIKARKRAIPKQVIIDVLNYLSIRSCSYLLVDFYNFALQFNFELNISKNEDFIKYLDERRNEEDEY